MSSSTNMATKRPEQLKNIYVLLQVLKRLSDGWPNFCSRVRHAMYKLEEGLPKDTFKSCADLTKFTGTVWTISTYHESGHNGDPYDQSAVNIDVTKLHDKVIDSIEEALEEAVRALAADRVEEEEQRAAGQKRRARVIDMALKMKHAVAISSAQPEDVMTTDDGTNERY